MMCINGSILRRGNGTGGIDPAIIERQIDNLNFLYKSHNIQFVQNCSDKFFYIDSDDYFNYSAENECELSTLYGHSDGLDIFFDAVTANDHLDPEDEDDVPLIYLGKAIDITGGSCIVKGEFTDSSNFLPVTPAADLNIVAHEIGHCLGLLHTHASWEDGGTSLCTGSMHPYAGFENENNCSSKGDQCCDTPADPNLKFIYCNPETCEIIEVIVDGENILEGFFPDMHNIMSYTHPACSNRFTMCQGKILRCGIAGGVPLAFVIPLLANVEINSDEVWEVGNLPEEGDYIITESLVVKSGSSLSIEAGVTVRFANNATLIVEPNAELFLYGKLTSTDCNSTWKGVQVYGNNEYSQYSLPFHQGLIQTFPGSMIENADIGVQLWGPSEEDSGGRLNCNETAFKNNRIGVDFIPFQNNVAGQPKSYVAKFKLCKFYIDNDFQFNQFDQHLLLYGVEGVTIAGCEFGNYNDDLNYNSQFDYGYGIAAIDAGFKVGAAATGTYFPGPCFPGGCEIIRQSAFNRLGFGIWTGTYMDNKFFSVYQSKFDLCYTGINVEGVSGGVMLFNHFNLGYLPDESMLNGDQIGIKLSQRLAGFTLEQDTFFASNHNTNHTIGISAENIGDINNVIRKNRFEGATYANEAFGQNAGLNLFGKVGLRYLCNENINTIDKDFFVSTDNYIINNINNAQLDMNEIGLNKAAGNKFSSTGNTSDGDFANNGFQISRYFHYPGDGNLDDYSGITDVVNGIINSCSTSYCAPPCLDGTQFNNLVRSYYSNLISFENEFSQSNFDGAVNHKGMMDNASKQILQHILVDTTTFSVDSLKKWYSNFNSISGDLLLARRLMYEGETEDALELINSISLQREVSADDEYDLSAISTIFETMKDSKIRSLSPSFTDSLIVFADTIGLASSIAKSILLLNGIYFETRYVVEKSVSPFVINNPSGYNEPNDGILIYPNPTFLDHINIFLDDYDKEAGYRIDLWSIDGKTISSNTINSRKTEIRIPESYNGIILYQVISNNGVLKSGKIFKSRI